MPRHTATRLAALALAQCRAPSVSHAGRLPPSPNRFFKTANISQYRPWEVTPFFSSMPPR